MAKTATKTGSRLSSAERREQVLEAAIKEFGRNGYHAASTSAIAERAGISQPYVYALFSSKKELFLAAHRHVAARIRTTFADAAEGAGSPEEALERAGDAYLGLLRDRDALLMQLQAHAAAGDPELQEEVRGEFIGLFDELIRITGATRERVVDFFAQGMLLNVAAALDLPLGYAAPRS